MSVIEVATTSLPVKKRGRRRLSPAFLLILPSMIFMVAFFGYPTVQAVLAAFTDQNGPTLTYAAHMWNDPNFGLAVRDTLLLIVAVIPIQFALALIMALALQAKPKFAALHFYLWAVPFAISDLAAGLVWLSIFDDNGYINSLLVDMGFKSIGWLNYQNYFGMLAAVAIAEIWRATSLVLIIIVSGMQGIPADYGEAAAVFGASPWQRFWHVTMPMLKPSLQVALILRTILAFQTFAVAQALTGQTFPLLVGETYRYYQSLLNPNVASVYAVLILVISMITAAVYLRLLRDQTIEGNQ